MARSTAPRLTILARKPVVRTRPEPSRYDAKNWLLYYRPESGTRIDESLTDADLATFIDYTQNVLFRRVKHFSGYVVAKHDGEGDTGFQH